MSLKETYKETIVAMPGLSLTSDPALVLSVAGVLAEGKAVGFNAPVEWSLYIIFVGHIKTLYILYNLYYLATLRPNFHSRCIRKTNPKSEKFTKN